MKQIISRVLKADDTATHDVSVGDVLNAVRTGGENLKPKVEKIRTVFQAELARSGDPQKAKLAVDPLKKRLPAVTFSGRFSRREPQVGRRFDKVMAHGVWHAHDGHLERLLTD